jgi:hypothetical protein
VRCDELEQAYDDSPYWHLLCDEWAEGVHQKLMSWSPRMARRFLSVSLFESSGGVYMLDESPETNHKLNELRERRSRLQSIAKPHRRGVEWFLMLFRS